MTHVILTGAAGFVGSHVLRHLLINTDWTVACPVTFRHKGIPRRIEVALTDLPESAGEPKEQVIVEWCDLRGPLVPAVSGHLGLDASDLVIINAASQSHVDRSIEDPVPFVENNVGLMLQVLELARRAPDLRAFIQVSTDEVYGPAPVGYASREWDPILPSNPYSASKAAQEAIAISYWRTYGVPLVITNTMNIVGETQDPEKFVPAVLRKILHDERVTIHASPDGTIGSRFYLHARNQADALLHLARKCLLAPQWGWVEEARLGGTSVEDCEMLRYEPGRAARPLRFNVVGEREVNNLEMARMLARFAGKDTAWLDSGDWYELEDFHSRRPGHDLRYALDGSRMRALGWKPPLSLDASLARTVEWTLRHPEWLDL